MTPVTMADWVVPVEIQTLRRWLLVAVGLLLIISLIELLRNDQRVTGLLSGAALLMGCRLCLIGRLSGGRRWLALPLAAAAVIVGLYLIITQPFSVYDLWSTGWLIVPAVIAGWWLCTSRVRRWSAVTWDAAFVDDCLRDNRTIAPRLTKIGIHTLLLHACVPVVIPLVWISDVAISPGNVLGGEIFDAFTLEHFQIILSSDDFSTWAVNSVIVAVGTTIVGLLLAVPAGYAFSRYHFYGRQASMFLFVLVQMFPGIIILLPYFMIMKTLGLLNSSLGLIIAYSVTALPLCVWMLKGFFDSIPREIEEAALIEGCTQGEIFRYIIVPLSLPAIGVTALFSFLTAWNEFLLALVFNTSNDQYTLPVGLASMIPQTGQQWGDFAAASILVSIPVVCLFIIFQKSLVHGLSSGAVKG